MNLIVVEPAIVENGYPSSATILLIASSGLIGGVDVSKFKQSS